MDPTQELADLKALQEKLNAKVAELEASLTEAKATAELTDEEKSHLASLAGSEQKRFRALDKVARKVELEKAREADPVVATIDGTEYRKSTPGSQLAKKLADQMIEVEKAKISEIAKAVYAGAPGTEDVHAAIVKALRNSGEPAEMQTKMLEAQKGLVSEFRTKAKAAGGDGETGAGIGADANPYEALTKGLEKFCAEQKIDIAKAWTAGLPRFEATDAGAALKRAYDASR